MYVYRVRSLLFGGKTVVEDAVHTPSSSTADNSTGNSATHESSTGDDDRRNLGVRGGGGAGGRQAPIACWLGTLAMTIGPILVPGAALAPAYNTPSVFDDEKSIMALYE
jgi:hypothetical protein